MNEEWIADEREQAVKRGGEIYADHYIEGLIDGHKAAYNEDKGHFARRFGVWLLINGYGGTYDDKNNVMKWIDGLGETWTTNQLFAIFKEEPYIEVKEGNPIKL